MPRPRHATALSTVRARPCLAALVVTLMSHGVLAQEAPPAGPSAPDAPAPAAATAPASPPAPAPAPTPAAAPPADGPGFTTGEVRWIPYLQIKIRDEMFSNYPNAVDVHDNNLVTRARFGMTAQWQGVEAVLQMQDVRAFGLVPPGTHDGGSFGVFQGYLGYSGDLGFVRAGRQTLDYGDQRMIGQGDWTMQGRSFDALRLHGVKGDFQLDLFGAVTHTQGTVSDDPAAPTVTARSEGSYLATAYGTWAADPAFHLDTYVLYRHDGASNGNLGQDDNIFAIGGRATGAVDIGASQLGYTVEIIGEVGSTSASGSADFGAYAAAADVRLRAPSDWKPTLMAGFSLGSGASGDRDEFNNFFPTNHKFYGMMDLIGLRNVIEGHVRLTVTPPDAPVDFYAEVLQLALQTSDDRWVNAAGNVVFAPAAPGAARNLGTELDFLVNYHPIPAIALQGGYALFIPESGAEERGFGDPYHYAYLQVAVATP